MKIAIVIGAMLLAPVSPIAAQTQEQTAEQPRAPEKKICQTEKLTGSLTRRTRTCLTAAQWRELNNRTRKGLDEFVGGASGGKECVVDAFGGCR